MRTITRRRCNSESDKHNRRTKHTYAVGTCHLLHIFGGLKGRGELREVRHGKRVSTKYWVWTNLKMWLATNELWLPRVLMCAGTGQSAGDCPVECSHDKWTPDLKAIVRSGVRETLMVVGE